jgi:ParB family chromosome partitioning protein
MGHARAILGMTDAALQQQVSADVLREELSVRQTEALVRRLMLGTERPPKRQAAPTASATNDVDTRAAEEKLKFALGTAVRIVRRGQRGRIEMDFGSEAELIRLYDYLTDRR